MDVKMDGCSVCEMRFFLVIHADCAVCSCQNSQPNLELRGDLQSITHTLLWLLEIQLKEMFRGVRQGTGLGRQLSQTLNLTFVAFSPSLCTVKITIILKYIMQIYIYIMYILSKRCNVEFNACLCDCEIDWLFLSETCFYINLFSVLF